MIKFENKSNGRYYYLIKNMDIFSENTLTIIRGGYNSRVVRHFGYNCSEIIEREIERISRIRIKRGYTLVKN